jgi:hypothetical protein
MPEQVFLFLLSSCPRLSFLFRDKQTTSPALALQSVFRLTTSSKNFRLSLARRDEAFLLFTVLLSKSASRPTKDASQRTKLAPRPSNEPPSSNESSFHSSRDNKSTPSPFYLSKQVLLSQPALFVGHLSLICQPLEIICQTLVLLCQPLVLLCQTLVLIGQHLSVSKTNLVPGKTAIAANNTVTPFLVCT